MNYECKFWPLVRLNEKQNTAVTNDLCRDEWYFGHDIMQTGKRNLKSLNSHKTGVSFVAKVELLETAELQVMASTSSYKGVHAFAALILIFALCATFSWNRSWLTAKLSSTTTLHRQRGRLISPIFSWLRTRSKISRWRTRSQITKLTYLRSWFNSRHAISPQTGFYVH